MLNNINLDHIRETRWYRQGGAIRLFYVFGPYFCVNETIGYDKNIMWQKGDVNTAFFGRDEEASKTRWIISRQMKNKKFIDRWIADWEKKNKEALSFCEKSLRLPLQQWSDKKLVNFLRRFQKLALAFWKKGVLCEWTDPDGQDILHSFIASFDLKLSEQEITALTAPERLTFLQTEFLERVGLARRQKSGWDISADLRRHTAKYHWFQNTWADVQELDMAHFKKLAEEDSKHLSERTKEAQDIRRHLLALKREKRRLYQEKKIPQSLGNVFYMFGRITDWRDYRKKMSVCLPNYYLHKILRRLARLNNLSEAMAGLLCYDEINGWKISSHLKKRLRKRGLGAIYICSKNRKCGWLYGTSARTVREALIESLNQGKLKGTTANRGKVRGRVKIIETKEDFIKMKAGDILVATMTRPEYVPLMKIAGGVVTNEGGVTCHAAIISRELGIPCVIGTQVATDILKDGDLVEVDAEKGIVRKIQ